jgi:hypothetical protein
MPRNTVIALALAQALVAAGAGVVLALVTGAVTVALGTPARLSVDLRKEAVRKP